MEIKNIHKDFSAQEVVSYAKKDGVLFAGTHLLIDLWGATNLNHPKKVEEVLINCAKATGATVLHSYMHHFTPQGVSGVVVLAESHISIHTWPERGYAALDIFVCGTCDPYKAIEGLKEYFKPAQVQIIESKRGVKV
ncbi:Adenosylmethionine decarboxylase [Candidatus Hepatincolaceae symbiont of Richtersius coronifer]